MRPNLYSISWMLLMAFATSVNAFETESPDLKIVCHKIESEGIVSAYETYLFEIGDYPKHSLGQLQWSYSLPLKGGEPRIVATSDEATFTIPVVGDESEYDISADKVIEGIVTLRYNAGGVENTTLYRFDLDLKPKIISYSEIIKTVNETKTAYSIDFTVRYTGKDYLRVGVMEDYSYVLKMKTIKEPYVAHVHRSSINIEDYAWVVLRVENQYGRDEVVITLENLIDTPDGSNNLIADSQIPHEFMDASFIKVYTKDGRYIMQIVGMDDLYKLDTDIYILQFYDNKGVCFKTTKYIKM